MNPQLIEFALRKQRLQFNAERERADMMYRLEGFESALDTVDRVRDGFAWARDHAPLLSTAALVLVLTRPRVAFRLAKRVWIGWMIFRRFQSSPRAKTASVLALPLVRRITERVLARVAGRLGRT